MRFSREIRLTIPVAPPHKRGLSGPLWTRGACSARPCTRSSAKSDQKAKPPDGSRPQMPQAIDAEKRRIEETRQGLKDWRRWGPYVSERQWGTVREDYSPGGTAMPSSPQR